VATNLSTANGLGMIMRDFGSGRGKLLFVATASLRGPGLINRK
jgi:hypothetical protein